jgi:hypothetical protein
MLELIQTGRQDCWDSVWGPVLFIVLPIGLLITAHFAYDSRMRNYSLLRVIYLSMIPYTVIWAIIAILGFVAYIPVRFQSLIQLLALCVCFLIGPFAGWLLVKRTLGYGDSEAGWSMIRWSIANLVLVLLINIALPNYMEY